jgi:hypothetical protein
MNINDLHKSIAPPSFNLPRIEPPKNHNLASEFYDRLVTKINDFNRTLDDKHEVGARLVSFGQSVTFHIESLGYWNPSLITFHGHTENGDPVELIQHVSQISVLLISMKRDTPEEPKKPIGFGTWEEFDKQKA